MKLLPKCHSFAKWIFKILFSHFLLGMSVVIWASLVAQMVKNLPAMQETWIRSLGWEDPLKKGKATHSRILAWRIPWTVLVRGIKKNQTRLSNFCFLLTRASLIAQLVKKPPAMQEAPVRFLGWEDPLEKG